MAADSTAASLDVGGTCLDSIGASSDCAVVDGGREEEKVEPEENWIPPYNPPALLDIVVALQVGWDHMIKFIIIRLPFRPLRKILLSRLFAQNVDGKVPRIYHGPPVVHSPLCIRWDWHCRLHAQKLFNYTGQISLRVNNATDCFPNYTNDGLDGAFVFRALFYLCNDHPIPDTAWNVVG